MGSMGSAPAAGEGVPRQKPNRPDKRMAQDGFCRFDVSALTETVESSYHAPQISKNRRI